MSHLESERYVLDSVHPEAGVTAGAQRHMSGSGNTGKQDRSEVRPKRALRSC